MGDSDEEYDQRRRDKFRSERSDYTGRGPPGPPSDDRRRQDWPDRRPPMPPNSSSSGYSTGGSNSGGGYQRPGSNYYPRPSGGDQSRDRRDGPSSYGGGHRGGGNDYRSDNRGRDFSPDRRGFDQPQAKRPRREDGDSTAPAQANFPTQPMMMTFKNFLAQQDDSIDDEEAVKKYAAYKMEFKKEQLSKFFAEHKGEEWFKSRYHPDECGKREKEIADGIQRRKNVWEWLVASPFMTDLSIDLDKTGEMLRFLDAAVIKLEGGSDFDLTILDTAEEPPVDLADLGKPKASASAASTTGSVVSSVSITEDDAGAVGGAASPKTPVKTEVADVEMKPKEETPMPKKQKRRGEDGEDDSGSDEDEEEEDKEKDGEKGQKDEEEKEKEETKKEATPLKAEDDAPAEEKVDEEASAGNGLEATPAANEEPGKPRPLHRTCSIFLRNLAPNITKQEVEAMCKKFPGYLRVAIADPQPERRFFRRGWVSFERNVNIKEICWNLNNIRLRDCDMGAIVNRDLSRRIRPVSGLTQHKATVKNDIRLAAKILQNYDKRHKLFEDETDRSAHSVKRNGAANGVGFAFSSKNPLLKNITDYLVDEADAEEEELLGLDSEKPKSPSDEIPLDRDDNLIVVLDRLILYLRLVHSFDYYNAIEYPSEDEMPNRAGIIHSRGPDPSTLTPPTKITQNDVNDWVAQFEKKIAPFLEFKDKLDTEEAKKMGFKEEEEEVEKFIQANTTELAKDKWLCPLSGKKFKGPDFVRKHILNKHNEKLDEAKKEVTYFNNYLLDPKRPQLPEHPSNKPRQPSSGSGSAQSNAPSTDSYGGHQRSSYGSDSYGQRGGNNYNDRSMGGSNSGYSSKTRDQSMTESVTIPSLTTGQKFLNFINSDRRDNHMMGPPSYGSNSYQRGNNSGYGHPPPMSVPGGDYQRGGGSFGRNQPGRPPPRGPFQDTRAIINYRDLDSPEDFDF